MDQQQHPADQFDIGDLVETTGGHVLHVNRIPEDGLTLSGVVAHAASPITRQGERLAVRPGDVRALTTAEIIGRRIEVNKKQRGHRFYPTAAELKKFPSLYGNEPEHGQEGDGDGDAAGAAAVVVAHYFTPGSRTDWWVTEYGKGRDLGLIYGFALIGGDTQGAEWGYSSLVELEQLAVRDLYPWPVIVERDLHWMPRAAREVIPQFGE